MEDRKKNRLTGTMLGVLMIAVIVAVVGFYLIAVVLGT
jgi:hypothetical protein